jgi:hypothetical protein
MKSVTFSDIVRVADQPRSVFTLRGKPGPGMLVLTLALGLAGLALTIHLIDPAAPLAYIVLPILAGGVLPLLGVVPGRFQVATRFDACHLIGMLDETLHQLGYAPATRGPGALRYRARAMRWPARGSEIGVTVSAHALEVTGPVPVLRALRERMGC